MKKYMKPAIEVLELEIKDVVTTSQEEEFDPGEAGLPVAP